MRNIVFLRVLHGIGKKRINRASFVVVHLTCVTFIVFNISTRMILLPNFTAARLVLLPTHRISIHSRTLGRTDRFFSLLAGVHLTAVFLRLIVSLLTARKSTTAKRSYLVGVLRFVMSKSYICIRMYLISLALFLVMFSSCSQSIRRSHVCVFVYGLFTAHFITF